MAWASQPTATGVAGLGLDQFNDPALTALVKQCLEQNPSWEAARARLEAARILVRQDASALRPKLDGLLNVSESEDQSMLNNARRTQASLGLEVGWEPDVWNRVGSQRDATALEAQGVAGDTQALALSLASQIALSWFTAIELQGLQDIAGATLKSFEQTLRVVEDRYQQGLVQSLDVHLTRASVANARAAEIVLQQSRLDTLRQLETLAGNYPDVRRDLPQNLPPLPDPVGAGLPSELLERRPDIRAAEARYHAAGFSIAAARKAWLPRISLSGQAGFRSDEVADPLTGKEPYWLAGAGLRQSLYNGGQLDAATELREAQERQAAATLAATILQAYREVESALSGESLLTARQKALAEALSESAEAERLAGEQYADGLTDIITVLESQRRLFEARSRELSVRAEILRNRIRLILALGGGLSGIDVDGEHP